MKLLRKFSTTAACGEIYWQRRLYICVFAYITYTNRACEWQGCTVAIMVTSRCISFLFVLSSMKCFMYLLLRSVCLLAHILVFAGYQVTKDMGVNGHKGSVLLLVQPHICSLAQCLLCFTYDVSIDMQCLLFPSSKTHRLRRALQSNRNVQSVCSNHQCHYNLFMYWVASTTWNVICAGKC